MARRLKPSEQRRELIRAERVYRPEAYTFRNSATKSVRHSQRLVPSRWRCGCGRLCLTTCPCGATPPWEEETP